MSRKFPGSFRKFPRVFRENSRNFPGKFLEKFPIVTSQGGCDPLRQKFGRKKNLQSLLLCRAVPTTEHRQKILIRTQKILLKKQENENTEKIQNRKSNKKNIGFPYIFLIFFLFSYFFLLLFSIFFLFSVVLILFFPNFLWLPKPYTSAGCAHQLDILAAKRGFRRTYVLQLLFIKGPS